MAEQLLPAAPFSDEIRNPEIHECLRDQQVWLSDGINFEPSIGHVDMVRRNKPKQAYLIDTSMDTVVLDDYYYHGVGGDGGRIVFAFKLPRIAEDMYCMPPNEGRTERVVIKCLNINEEQQQQQEEAGPGGRVGTLQDVYREIHLMQTIGDNIHVLGCIEVLRDLNTLYIVMPFYEEGPSTTSVALSQNEALRLFIQVLDNLSYLRERQICHRDLSPENLLFYQGRVILTGLTRSFKLPSTSSVVIPDMTIHGTPAFQPPEVFLSSRDRLNYDAYQCDLWSAGLIFFYLLTGEILYHIPRQNDHMFRCFILARGIAGVQNDLIEDCFQDADQVDEEFIIINDMGDDDEDDEVVDFPNPVENLRRARRMCKVFAMVQNLRPEVREILDNVLKVSPQERWNLDRVKAATLNLIRSP